MASSPPCQQRLSEEPTFAQYPGYSETPRYANTLITVLLNSTDVMPEKAKWRNKTYIPTAGW